MAREKRTALAKRTARVRLEWPAKALSGYTIVDTPGINEVNEAVVATTYRVIPEADVTIFMKRAQMLGEIEKKFLQSRVFGSGISRCLMVVNTGESGNTKPASQLDQILRTIRADLRDIGREYVPVESVLLPCPVDDSQEQLASATPEEQASIERFGGTLHNFLAANVEPGRQERARAVLAREVRLARTEAQVELSALHKSPAELAELERKISEDGREFKRRYRRVGQEFLNDLKAVQQAHYASLAKGLDAIGSQYVEGFTACPTLGGVQARLQTADLLLRPAVEELFFRTAEDSLLRIRELEQKYQADFEQEARSWLQGVEREFKLDGGLLSKLPAVLVLVLDVVLTDILLPGGWIIAILERWILTKIPVIRDLLPSSILRQVAVSHVRQHVAAQFSECKAEIRDRIDGAYQEAGRRLTEAWEASSEEQLQTVIDPLKRAVKESKNPAREAALKGAITSLDAVLAQIQ